MMKRMKMKRVGDKVHPHDLEEGIKNQQKYERKCERARLRSEKRSARAKVSNSKYESRRGEPYIKDSRVFKAVSFARKIRFDNNKPIELAMYQAAKYYKVPLEAVASAMGEIASFHRWKT